MPWFCSKIQKQRVIPVFRGGKRTCSGAGARPRKDRNPVPEAVDAGLDAFVVILEKGTADFLTSLGLFNDYSESGLALF